VPTAHGGCDSIASRSDSAAGGSILVDTGIGSATAPARSWAPVPGRLPAELGAAGIEAADVDTVVLTHMHTDHIGWSMTTPAPPSSNARYLLKQNEIDAIDANAPGVADWLPTLRGSGIVGRGRS